MDIVNAVQTDILELLARFKFLTLSLIKPLVGKSTTYIREQLQRLTVQGYIAFFRLDKPGKAEHLYYLTPAGKDLLLQFSKSFAADIKLPIGTPLVVRDYAHRVKYISVTIALYYWLQSFGFTVTHMASYFDKTGNNKRDANLHAQTRLPLAGSFYIPDGIIACHKGSEQMLLLVEMYCDTSVQRVREQLHKHMLAIAEGSPGMTYNMPVNPLVLSVFAHASIMRRIIEDLQHEQAFIPFHQLFFFAELDAVQKDIAHAFHSITEKTLALCND